MNFVLVYLGPEPEQTEELIYFVWFFFSLHYVQFDFSIKKKWQFSVFLWFVISGVSLPGKASERCESGSAQV